MDNKHDGLWQGGPWEQPSQPVPNLPYIPVPAAGIPVLRPRKRRRKWPWITGLAILVLALCLLTVVLGHHLSFSLSGPGYLPANPGEDWWAQQEEYSTDPPNIRQAPTGTGVTLPLQAAAGPALTYTQIYEKNAPSIVSIESQSQSEYGTGTGIIMTEDGYIITNAHVVAGADEVRVALSNNSVLQASLVGFDADEDLAVLKVDASGLTPAEFGDSAALRIGDPVAAIGDPLGYRSTITDGIISALDREVEVDGTTMVLIQTSAAINFGNSGGALINQYGQVVGVTTIKIVADDGSAEGLGFAIPTTRVKQVVDRLIAGAPVTRPSLGIIVRRGQGENGGLVVEEVDPDSDCHRQGIQPQDIIVAANGQQVQTFADLERIKRTLDVGDSLLLEVLRGGEHLEFTVTLMDQDDF